ncbi:Rap1 GTPase-GDP dissociation stimulator 1 [Coemansia sp. RSA 2705]|nr:Rap1 GTPase-GDP dissociation stimulator 1 [Coemansia sp. RSA 2705]
MVHSTKAQRETAGPSPAAQWLAALDSRPAAASLAAAQLAPMLTHMLEHPDQALASAHIVATAKTFKALADMGRDAAVRAQLAATDLARATSTLLRQTEADLSNNSSSGRAERVFLLVQLLRCVCNQSADHDGARAALLEHGAVAAVARVLCSDDVARQPLPLGQAAFGAALNVALDHADCADALLAAGALPPHVRALQPGSDALAIWPLVCSSLDNLCEREAAVAQLEQDVACAPAMLQALAANARALAELGDDESDGDDEPQVRRGAMRTLLWVLCEALEKSAVVRQQLCESAHVLLLLDVLDHYLAQPVEPAETAELAAPDAQPPNRPMPQQNRYADAAAQMLVGVSGEDAALALFDDAALTARLLAMLAPERAGDRTHDARAAAAALCLGNLARTDAHCEHVVRAHPQLAQALVGVWLGDAQTVDVRTRHAASGLLKNLCVAAANKQRLADMGLAAVAARCMRTAVVPVQANCIGILRHLVNGASALQTAQALLAGDACALAELLDAVRSTDIDGIRCEGTRLVAAVAKKAFLPRAAADADALRALQPRLAELDLVTPLVRLIMLDGQRHPLLQQESLVALTVLASAPAAPFAARLVCLLVPANSVPLATPLAAAEGTVAAEGAVATEDTVAAEDIVATEDTAAGFDELLARLLRQEGAVWPQTTLQAKSLVAQLQHAVKQDPAAHDSLGLEILHTKLSPLA